MRVDRAKKKTSSCWAGDEIIGKITPHLPFAAHTQPATSSINSIAAIKLKKIKKKKKKNYASYVTQCTGRARQAVGGVSLKPHPPAPSRSRPKSPEPSRKASPAGRENGGWRCFFFFANFLFLQMYAKNPGRRGGGGNVTKRKKTTPFQTGESATLQHNTHFYHPYHAARAHTHTHKQTRAIHICHPPLLPIPIVLALFFASDNKGKSKIKKKLHMRDTDTLIGQREASNFMLWFVIVTTTNKRQCTEHTHTHKHTHTAARRRDEKKKLNRGDSLRCVYTAQASTMFPSLLLVLRFKFVPLVCVCVFFKWVI